MQKRLRSQINIHIISFNLNESLYRKDENIRVSITSAPEHQKDFAVIPSKLMDSFNHILHSNITNETSKILIVFRRAVADESNPIIASTTIRVQDFPIQTKHTNLQSGFFAICPTGTWTLDIYSPKHNSLFKYKFGNLHENQRKVVGKVKFQIDISPFSHDNSAICNLLENPIRNCDPVNIQNIHSIKRDETKKAEIYVDENRNVKLILSYNDLKNL